MYTKITILFDISISIQIYTLNIFLKKYERFLSEIIFPSLMYPDRALDIDVINDQTIFYTCSRTYILIYSYVESYMHANQIIK